MPCLFFVLQKVCLRCGAPNRRVCSIKFYCSALRFVRETSFVVQAQCQNLSGLYIQCVCTGTDCADVLPFVAG